jgi:hypothetical protein
MNRVGINRAIPSQYENFKRLSESGTRFYSIEDPCIFVSHKKEDKNEARIVVKYIEEAGIDVYFDENDTLINDPEIRNDPLTTTQAINRALERSTHMITLISNKTKESWWVPYEIGYACKKSPTFYSNIRAMFVKGFNENKPEYLEIIQKIKSKIDLDTFLKAIGHMPRLLNEDQIFKFSTFGMQPIKTILL